MKRYLLIILSVLSGVVASGQYDIDVEIKGYPNDTLIAGYFLGDKQLVLDTLYAKKPGKFELKGDTTLNQGFYMLLTLTDNKFIQFIIDEDQEFSIASSIEDLSKVKFKGTTENEIFTDYVDFLAVQRPKADVLRTKLQDLDPEGEEYKTVKADLDKLDAEVEERQSKMLEEHPNTMTAMIIRSNFTIDIPEFEGTEEEVQIKRYLYYKEHYFDHIEMDNPLTLRTPFLDKRIQYYLKNLTPNHPDSISTSMDYILDKVSPAPETFRFYLSTFLNQYIKSKIVGMDAVYVHLAENYYAKGKAPWLEEETLNKIVDNAMDIKPVLIGKTGPDLKLMTQDSVEVKISEMEYEYLVLMFWAPDCGHCKKSMPSVVEFYDEYKDKGVKMLAICTKHGEKTKNCWEGIEEKGMGDFVNVADQYNRSQFRSKYNVKTTPKIFVLNQEREILMKNIGGEQLGAVMEELFRREEQDRLKEAGN